MNQLYEILVPTEKPEWVAGKRRYFRTKHHKKWDALVVAIANGLTILQPSRGQWVSPTGTLFRERMIPVRISCTEDQIQEIMDLTAKHYSQLAIMAYKISDQVLIKNYEQKK